MGGKSDELKGRVKEAVGSLVADEDLKRKGRAEQAAGRVKQKVSEAIDKAKDALTGEKKKEKKS